MKNFEDQNKKRTNRTSKQWMFNHKRDVYVKKAKEKNYRSRAAFKLIEINNKFKILNKNDKVLDVGSRPGSWSQVALEFTDKVWALDILKMDDIEKVSFTKMDITINDGKDFIELFQKIIGVNNLNLIMSDAACNTTGNAMVDHCRTTVLNRIVLSAIPHLLAINGNLVFKTFNGEETSDLIKETKELFEKVKVYKPLSSKAESKEIYVVALKRL